VAESLTACDLLVGSGTAMYPEQLPATAQLVHVDAGHLILAAAALAARGGDLSSTEPRYLREPDAAQPTARKSALGRGGDGARGGLRARLGAAPGHAGGRRGDRLRRARAVPRRGLDGVPARRGDLPPRPPVRGRRAWGGRER